MPDITVSIDGTEHTVSSDDVTLPDGHMLAREDDYVQTDYMNEEMSRRLTAAKKNALSEAKDELREDEDFIKRVASEQAPDVDLDAHRQEWEKEAVQPLRERLGTYQQKMKRAEIVRAAREAGIDDRFLTSVSGKDPYIASVIADRVAEVEPGEFAVTDGEGNPLPGTGGTRYKTVSDFLAAKRDDDEWSGLFQEPKGPNGTGSSGKGGAAAVSSDEKARRERAKQKMRF